MSEIILKKISETPAVTTMGAADYFPVNVDVGAGVFKTRHIARDAIPFPSGLVSYVDGSGGNDTTAARGDFKKRFATPLAAAAAATSGDVIVVFPGSYTVTANLARNGVNWHLMAGAVLQNASSSSALFDDSPSGLNADMIFSVTGYGDLEGTDASGSSRVLFIGRAVSNVRIRCRSIYAEETSICVFGGGTSLIECDTAYMLDADDSGEAFSLSGTTTVVTLNVGALTCEGGDAIVASETASLNYTGDLITATAGSVQSGINWASTGILRLSLTQTLSVINTAFLMGTAGTAYLEFDAILCGQGAAGNGLNFSAGTVYARGRLIQCGSNFNSCLLMTGTAAFEGNVRRLTGARQAITNAASGTTLLIDATVVGACDFTGTGQVRLVNVHGTGIDNFGNREPFLLGASSDVIFQNCVGKTAGAATYSIDASGSCSARVYGSFNGDLFPNGVITFIVGGSNVYIDPDVV